MASSNNNNNQQNLPGQYEFHNYTQAMIQRIHSGFAPEVEISPAAMAWVENNIEDIIDMTLEPFRINHQDYYGGPTVLRNGEARDTGLLLVPNNTPEYSLSGSGAILIPSRDSTPPPPPPDEVAELRQMVRILTEQVANLREERESTANRRELQEQAIQTIGQYVYEVVAHDILDVGANGRSQMFDRMSEQIVNINQAQTSLTVRVDMLDRTICRCGQPERVRSRSPFRHGFAESDPEDGTPAPRHHVHCDQTVFSDQLATLAGHVCFLENNMCRCSQNDDDTSSAASDVPSETDSFVSSVHSLELEDLEEEAELDFNHYARHATRSHPTPAGSPERTPPPSPVHGGDLYDGYGASEPSDFGSGPPDGNEDDHAMEDRPRSPPNCPEWCGCCDADAGENMRHTWSPRSSNSSDNGNDHFLARRNVYRLRTDNEQVIDPELEGRAQYMFEAVLNAVETETFSREEQTMHYMPLPTETVLATNPPQAEWLTDLFRPEILDEEIQLRAGDAPLIRDPNQVLAGLRDSTLREECANIIELALQLRTIMHTLMTTPDPYTYLEMNLHTIEALCIGFENSADFMRIDVVELNCRRMHRADDFFRAAFEYPAEFMLSLNLHQRGLHPSFILWTTAEALCGMRHCVRQLEHQGLGVGLPPIEVTHWDGPFDRTAAHLADAATVFQFCRFVVRLVDMAFSALRMESWAFRRYEQVRTREGGDEAQDMRIVLHQYPTMYDSVTVIEHPF